MFMIDIIVSVIVFFLESIIGIIVSKLKNKSYALIIDG